MTDWVLRLLTVVCLLAGCFASETRAEGTLFTVHQTPAGNCTGGGGAAFDWSARDLIGGANALVAWANQADCVNEGQYHLHYSLGSIDNATGHVTVSCTGWPNGDCSWTTDFATSCSSGTPLASGECSAACPASGTVFSTGKFDYGTNGADTSGFGYRCTATGCGVSFSGVSPAGRALVAGTFHYFAQGVFAYDGGSCTPSPANLASQGLSEIPANTCDSTTVATTINGQVKCVVKGSGAVSTTMAPDAKQTTTVTNVTNSDGSVTRSSTTVYADGSQSTKLETFPNATARVPNSVSVGVQGSGTSQAGQANPGAVAGGASGAGTGSGWPSDYARAGEAGAAATSINTVLGGKIDALGDKIDKITEDGPAPTDLVPKTASDFDAAFFPNTFDNLLAWQVPAHSSQCPTGSFSWGGHSYTIDAHCGLVSTYFGALSSIMVAVWLIVALFILLRA